MVNNTVLSQPRFIFAHITYPTVCQGRDLSYLIGQEARLMEFLTVCNYITGTLDLHSDHYRERKSWRVFIGSQIFQPWNDTQVIFTHSPLTRTRYPFGKGLGHVRAHEYLAKNKCLSYFVVHLKKYWRYVVFKPIFYIY